MKTDKDESKKYSITEIAELANVSSATVSRVINKKGGYSAQTEKKILDIISEVNYRPNLVAKGLRTSKTNVIGLIVPDIVNEFYAKLVLEIQMKLFSFGYLTVVCNINEDKDLEKELVDVLTDQNISGLILISGNSTEIPKCDFPIIHVDRRPYKWHRNNTEHIVIESDNFNGGYIATKELIDSGCQNIGFITDVLEQSSKMGRFQGYVKAFNEYELRLNPKATIEVLTINIDAIYELVKENIESGLEFDGIFCTTDSIAIGTILALKECGLRVPEDVKVVGFDDITISSLFTPSISTVHQNTEMIAKYVSKILLDLINGKVLEQKHYVIPVDLILRESTKKEGQLEIVN